jgi:RNA polymerase sigma-70 factor (ECF subfamily)
MLLTLAWAAQPASAADDRALIDGLRRRDPEAMARLYDQFGRVVYALIHRIVQNPGVAEDLVQETFLRVWNQAQALDPERGSVAAWLLTVARHRAIDWRRSADGKRDSSRWETYEDERPGNFVDMEKALVDADQARRVREALSKLNEKQRGVIELAYFEGLTQTEMSARLGEPLGTVKTWVRAALKCLREELSVEP